MCCWSDGSEDQDSSDDIVVAVGSLASANFPFAAAQSFCGIPLSSFRVYGSIDGVYFLSRQSAERKKPCETGARYFTLSHLSAPKAVEPCTRMMG